MVFTEAGIASLFRFPGGYIKLVCVLLFASRDLLSQSQNFKNYSVDDVLPSSTIYAAFQDSRGFMWFVQAEA